MFHDGGIYFKKSTREGMRQSEGYLAEHLRLDHKTGGGIFQPLGAFLNLQPRARCKAPKTFVTTQAALAPKNAPAPAQAAKYIPKIHLTTPQLQTVLGRLVLDSL